MICSHLARPVVRLGDTTRRLWTGAGQWAIAATVAAGVVGTLLPTRIEVGGGKRRAWGAGYRAGREAMVHATVTPAGVQPTNRSKPKPAPSAPITGPILDREGRPVAGVTVWVAQVRKSKGGDLTPWIESIQRGDPYWWIDHHLRVDTSVMMPEEKRTAATTDAQGRFHCDGLGGEQLVTLTIQGPAIADTALEVITRRTQPIPAREFPWDRSWRVRTIYCPFDENEFAQVTPVFSQDLDPVLQNYGDRYQTKPDGTSRLVGLPGRGIVGVHLHGEPDREEG
jgi:hypothetical protein